MIFVRADGNAKIGAGHLMRCLTIIEAYVEISGTKDDILFVCADEMSAALVRERGFQAKVFGTDYRDMESELPYWAGMFSRWSGFGRENCEQEGCGRHTFLVDSYYVTRKYLKGLQPYGRVILLDDMQKEAYPVDAVVNYNVFAEESKYLELYRKRGQDCMYTKHYVGGLYVPIRPQFLQKAYAVADEVKDVLITTGGGNVDNIAGAILQAIYNPALQYHLVIGRFNPHRQELEQVAARCNNVHLHMDVKDMAGLMRKCDLAITAGGTTIYELAAMGVPFICFSYAENQEALTSFLGEKEIAYFAGAYHKEPERVLECMKAQVEKLCADVEKRRGAFRKERELIDGQGAKRLAEVLLAGD